jgi:Flp pilus assembly pilin Flp
MVCREATKRAISANIAGCAKPRVLKDWSNQVPFTALFTRRYKGPLYRDSRVVESLKKGTRQLGFSFISPRNIKLKRKSQRHCNGDARYIKEVIEMVRKSQSILEYIIVLSAIIVAVIAAAKGPVTTAVEKMFTDSTGMMESKTGSFAAGVGTSAAMQSAH